MSDRVEIGNATLYCGDALTVLRSMETESVQCVVTSPPYFGLRDYGHDGQLGLEPTPHEYVQKLVEIFREVRRVLRGDGTVWLNLGDSYAGSWGNAGGHNRGKGSQRPIVAGSSIKDQAVRNGSFVPPAAGGFKTDGIKPKDLIGIPWRAAFALQDDGWYLRQDIIWYKPNPVPESVTDRCTKAHEYVFLLSKSARYYYDADAVSETGRGRPIFDNNSGRAVVDATRNDHGRRNGVVAETRNRRSVWTVSTRPYAGAHFATFPPELPRTCILAGTKPGDVVLDPFMGSGTAGEVAVQMDRLFIGNEISETYMNDLAIPRIDQAQRQGRLAL